MLYTALPVQVEAHRITEVVHVVRTGKKRTFLVLEGLPGRTALTPAILTRFAPKRGDYLVSQGDGEQMVISHDIFHLRFA